MSGRKMITKVMAEIVKDAMEDSSLSTEQVRSICETFLTVIIDKVKAGEDVTLLNFLKFERLLVKERTFSIPNSEEKTTKPEHYSLKVKVMDGTKDTFENLPIVWDNGTELQRAKVFRANERARAKARANKKAQA